MLNNSSDFKSTKKRILDSRILGEFRHFVSRIMIVKIGLQMNATTVSNIEEDFQVVPPNFNDCYY